MIGVVSASTLFEDDFEADMSQWDPSSPTSDVYLSDSLTSGDYYLVVKDDKSAIASIDTTGYENIQFSYDRRTYSTESGDYLRIYWRVGNSGSWTLLESVASSSWSVETWPLSGAEDESEIQIRFKLDNGNHDYGLVDDVEVTGDSIGEQSCDITVSPPEAGEYYNDDILIEWLLSQDCYSPTYNLHFNEDTCTPANPTDWEEIVDSVNGLEYDWTSGICNKRY